MISKAARLILLFLFLQWPTPGSSAQAIGTDQVALENSLIKVVFQDTGQGPRLTSITWTESGNQYMFDASESLGLALVDITDLNNPSLIPVYQNQDRFRFVGAREGGGGREVQFRFALDELEALVKYELEGAVVKKTISCTALDSEVYVAGIVHWNLRPSNLAVVWPGDAELLGQPVVFKGSGEGCFVTLEWGRARHSVSEDGRTQLSCRPGFRLAPGESRELTVGAIGLFAQPPNDSVLESARRSFFSYITDRLAPRIPFPVKFTTWGPWLGQAREDRILEVLDDLAYVGVDLFHFDAGWQWPDYPYSEKMARVGDADDATWDLAMTLPERLPNGFLPLIEELKKRGLKLSLWNDANGSVFVRETDNWAVRDPKGNPVIIPTWEGRWREAPLQSLAYPPYADRLYRFSMELLERYDLGGIMFDNNRPRVRDYGLNRRSLASGWNSPDVSIQTIWRILDEAEKRKPGIYRFLCMASPWPWNLKYATHIHAGDPGRAGEMREAMAADFPARALSFERYLAWRNRYHQFVPPWGIKGDVAGWSVQQASAIPVNLDHTEGVIGSGEGWTYNMMTCFATTAVRDIRFSFRQVPQFDKKILKEWLAWDRSRSHFVHNLRIISDPPDNPNEGIVGISHVGGGQGVIYLFNRSFDLEEFELVLDERGGFDPSDRSVAANLIFPMKARFGSGLVSYGQKLVVPIIGKDCVVIEFGLEAPEGVKQFEDYCREAERVKRSYKTLFRVPVEELVSTISGRRVQLETGSHSHDQILAKHIVEAIGGALGQRIRIEDWESDEAQSAECRLLIGTHEGLREHRDLGEHFQETLYNRYLDWDGELISGPLLAKLDSSVPTFCLIAPRSDQLTRLSIDLMHRIGDDAERIEVIELPAEYRPDRTVQCQIPYGKVALKFKPAIESALWMPAGRLNRHTPIPGDLGMVHFEIEVESEGRRQVLWAEDVPPFYGPPWWDYRILPVEDLAGTKLTFHFKSRHVNGVSDHRIRLGFKEISLVRLPE